HLSAGPEHITQLRVVSRTSWRSYNIAITLEAIMTIEGYEGERVLLSYDVAGSRRAVAARVCQIVFGRDRISECPEHVRYRRRDSSTGRGRLDWPERPYNASW